MRYYPIDIPIAVDALSSDIAWLEYFLDALTVDFFVPADRSKLLRTTFSEVDIFRFLDEIPLSTEGEEGDRKGPGRRNDTFVYRTEGDLFWRHQSAIFKESRAETLQSYLFITGFGCLNVIGPVPPEFEVVSIDPDWVAKARAGERPRRP